MELGRGDILYRRVPWLPKEAQWWKEMGGVNFPEKGFAALRPVADPPRRDESGAPVPGKAGTRERGLSVDYANVPSARAASAAALDDLEGYRVVGFYVGELLDLGLIIEVDPTYPGHPAYLESRGPNPHHTVIIGTPACSLLSKPGRKALHILAYHVDINTGVLTEKYLAMKRRLGVAET